MDETVVLLVAPGIQLKSVHKNRRFHSTTYWKHYSDGIAVADDDFVIKSKYYSLIYSSCFDSYLEFFQDVFIFRNLF